MTRTELLPVFIVSNRLGLSVGFLDHARRAGFGPPYVRVGRETLYDWASVVAWVTERGLALAEAKDAPHRPACCSVGAPER